MSKDEKIENWISKHYAVRYNTILFRPELCKLTEKKEWIPMDDRILSSIIRAMSKDLEFRPTKDLVYSILESDFSKSYNPFQDFFGNMKVTKKEKIDAKNPCPTIRKMASTVKVSQLIEGKDMQLIFEHCLQMWLTASVANVLNTKKCENSVCLVLTGGQGAFKTTWLNNLYPSKYLGRHYLFCDEFQLRDKDTKKRLATMFMINIDDQLRDINKSDAEILKTYISLNQVIMRLSYGKYDVEMPRIANFCGSVNGNDFLTDSTGARRFWPFQVQSIDIEAAQKIDIYEMWNEAYTMYKNGTRYYLSAAETKEWFQGAEAFSVQTKEYEFLTTYFKPTKNGKIATKLKTSEIMMILKDKTRYEMNQKRMVDALNKAGFEQKSSRREGVENAQYYWWVIELTDEDIRRNRSEQPTNSLYQ